VGDFAMPSLGAGMEEGMVAAWKRRVGDTVRRGDVIAEIETEKGLIEVEIWETGVVTAIHVEEGQTAAVGTPLATIEPRAEVEPPPPAAAPEPPRATVETPVGPRATPGARQLAREAEIDLGTVAATGPHDTVTRSDLLREVRDRRARPRVSPYARRRARELGVDLTAVAPGPDGVVHARDVEAAAPRRDPVGAMRRAIAQAMTLSKRTIPHYYLSQTIDLGPAMAWLEARNEGRPPSDRLVAGALLLHATVGALKKVPELNAHWTGEDAPPIGPIHLGVAIALRGGGLVAPAIFDAHTLSVEGLMERLEDLVTRARRGRLKASELAGGTVTVTSLGDRGVEAAWGVINPPQVAMIGFGRVLERPWAIDGEVQVRPTVVASLAADHRVTDGHRGGVFLRALERRLLRPEEER
jgi:pyruvate dehydrogenase E2 component (dihydrolipoamide acetyltransferase)